MMHTDRRRSAILLLFLSSHPGPSVAVAAMCVVLGITTLEAWRVAVVGVAVLLGQFSVGLSNDWLDAGRDHTVGRADKPAAAGDISVVAVRNAAFVTGAMGLALTTAVGPQATIAHTLFIAAGWAYNLGLKKTALSVLPYIVGFGALPAVVTLAREDPAAPVWWAMSAGAALGVAAHFANALPDLADDRATGVVGLPHRVGSRASSLITFAALAATTAVIVFGADIGVTILGWFTLTTETVIVGTGAFLALTRPPGRWLFRLVILGALIAVAALAFSGGQLAG